MYKIGDYVVKNGNGVCRIEDIPEISIQNDKLREQKYKEIMKSIEPESLVRIIKTTYLRKKARLERGKKNTAADEHYLAVAEKLLFSELCLVLGKTKEEVQNLIVEKINKK